MCICTALDCCCTSMGVLSCEMWLCRVPTAAARPRILICAPSNAAADELLQRIMNTGFSDAQVCSAHHTHIPARL